MHILLLSSGKNSLTQATQLLLQSMQHNVSVAVPINTEMMHRAVAQHRPDFIICPFLKIKIPPDIWKQHICIIIHPGIHGDRGLSSLDWAILDGQTQWGVTALQANDILDGGTVWASKNFEMDKRRKSSIYRHEIRKHALELIRIVVDRFVQNDFPDMNGAFSQDINSGWRSRIKQQDRQIDWKIDDSDTVLRKINSADGSPGLLTEIEKSSYYLYGAHLESNICGKPGRILAKRHGAICLGTSDGSVWITHLKNCSSRKTSHHKLPATTLLAHKLKQIPEITPSLALTTQCLSTYRDIAYQEIDAVGYLTFNFYNGAMDIDQCRRLQKAWIYAKQRPTKVIVLVGGLDFWSTGIHLNQIDAAKNPSSYAWGNLLAINQLIYEIMMTTTHHTIALVRGDVAAGGVMLALACDHVWSSNQILWNPHYRSMGLYGSEYWTYSLPKRVGHAVSEELILRPQAISTEYAAKIGLIDRIIPDTHQVLENTHGIPEEVQWLVNEFTETINRESWISNKKNNRKELDLTLRSCVESELMKMHQNIFSNNWDFHHRRHAFIRKQAYEG